MKKTFLLTLIAVLFAACQESLEERCAKEVSLYNKKNCPAKLSENIFMDSVAFEPSTHTISYYYTLTGVADTTLTEKQQEVKDALLNELKAQQSDEEFDRVLKESIDEIYEASIK